MGSADVLEALSGGLSGACDWVLLLIIIEHVGQDVLRVLQTLRHLRVVTVQRLIQRHRRSLALLVHVRHVPIL